MIHLEAHHLETVRCILKNRLSECEVWAFGSRVHAKNLKKFSDLDLVLISQKALKSSYCAEIQEAFSESDLPIQVDVSDWANLSESLQKSIQNQHEVLLK